MKLLFCSIFALCFIIRATNGQGPDQGRPNSKRKRRAKNACVVVFSEKDFEDRREEEQPLECELRGQDLNGTHFSMIKIKGLKASWAKKNKIKSGSTTLFALNSTIDDETNELIINTGQAVELGGVKEESPNSERSLSDNSYDTMNRNLLTGTKRVLVIRAVASDKSTTSSEATLSDDIFGTSGDVVNLKSQYSRCSDGKLQFTPVTTNTLVGTDGVYTVNLPSTVVTGASDGTIRDAMVNQATADLGTLTNIADYVMLCLPPGTSGGWIAYAYINYWLSVYNDEWCRYPSAQLHEIGHNINLAHSNEGTVAYGDQSCMMGYSYESDETPVMCFNGPKTHQLGWYSEFHVDIPVSGSFNWNGNLIGFAEKSSASLTDKMIIRIITATTDTYIHFNRMIGMNIGTQEGGNQVLVTTRSTGTGYAESNLQSKMSSNSVYSIPNFNGSASPLIITVNSIVTNTIPGRASITVQFGDSLPPTPVPTLTPTLTPTPLPTTERPTPLPTPVPTTDPPTLFPTTKSPTSLPSPEPTTLPPTSFPTTFSPTSSPTPEPTFPPTTDNPTQPPSPDPTTPLPSKQPTNPPNTGTPTVTPTVTPTATPTVTPTLTPTEIPTVAPTETPTIPPTVTPLTPLPTDLITPSPISDIPTLSPTLPPITLMPTASPMQLSTPLPTTEKPSDIPTTQPTSAGPTPDPSPDPPTALPTSLPTSTPTTPSPTQSPSPLPTNANPTQNPTVAPTTALPSPSPTPNPTTTPPTPSPTTKTPPPSKARTASPTPFPTPKPTRRPTPKCNFNSRCEIGEDCNSCPYDCNGRGRGFCCKGGVCNDRRCNGNGWNC